MADPPTTPKRIKSYISTIPSPKADSYLSRDYQRYSKSRTTGVPVSIEAENTIELKGHSMKPNDIEYPSHLTSFYKENIRELNHLQDILFQKKAMLDSLNDELNECKEKYESVELKWQALREEKTLKSQQLSLKHNELMKMKQEEKIKTEYINQSHKLNLQQLKARHEADLNEVTREYQEKFEILKFSKIKKFQEQKEKLLDKVEEVRNMILTNDESLQDLLKEQDMKDCSSKEEWLQDFQKEWKQNVEINEECSTRIVVLQTEIQEILKPEVESKRRKILDLTAELHSAKIKNEKSIETTKRLDCEITSKLKEIEELKNSTKELEEYISNTEIELQQIQEILIKEETMRRSIHNELQELRGNIRVFCRVRPPLIHENGKPRIINVRKFDDTEGTQKLEIRKHKTNSTVHVFKFDRIFDQDETNSDVFAEICQLVQSSLDGYNVCIFAYGQTGSGKTYTMLNPGDGIIPATISHIFSWINELKERGWYYEVNCQFVEIYNEVIADLFREENKTENQVDDIHKNMKHEIRHDNETQTTTITNVTTCPIISEHSVDELLKNANRLRATALTAANDRSSRSHSIFIIHLHGKNKLTGENSHGVLNLVDLAGSERINVSQVVGDRLRETQNINRSLSCLGDVIHALSSPDASRRHIPFRNSKLTYLLQYSLMGASKTLMFVNISACYDDSNESINSLRFASKVNSTKLIAKKKPNNSEFFINN